MHNVSLASMSLDTYIYAVVIVFSKTLLHIHFLYQKQERNIVNFSFKGFFFFKRAVGYRLHHRQGFLQFSAELHTE